MPVSVQLWKLALQYKPVVYAVLKEILLLSAVIRRILPSPPIAVRNICIIRDNSIRK